MELTKEYLDAVTTIRIVCVECGHELIGTWDACDGDAVIRINQHACSPEADAIANDLSAKLINFLEKRINSIDMSNDKPALRFQIDRMVREAVKYGEK